MTMRATHIDYQHFNHLRVDGGPLTKSWNIGQGWFETEAICVAPNSDLHKKLYRRDIPSLDPKLRARKLQERRA